MKTEMKSMDADGIVLNAFKWWGNFDGHNKDEEWEQHEEHRKDKNRFGVKDLLFCKRATYYKKTMPIDELESKYAFNEESIVRIVRGALYDKLIGEFLGEQSQIKIEKKTMAGQLIVGVLDGDIDDMVYELKTISDRGLWYVKKNGIPNAHDKFQAMMYAYMTGKKKVQIDYISPDDVVTFIMEFTPDELDAVWKEGSETAFELYTAISNKSPPKKQKLGSWKCKSCRFKELCWGEKSV